MLARRRRKQQMKRSQTCNTTFRQADELTPAMAASRESRCLPDLIVVGTTEGIVDVVEEGDHGGVTADGDGSKIFLNC